MPALIFPTIHLNGSSKERLLEQLQAARAAGTDFVQCLEAMTPHDRDYYPQGPDAGKQARDQHHDRLHAVYVVQDELNRLYRNIMEQGK
jgi:hypothetical protein